MIQARTQLDHVQQVVHRQAQIFQALGAGLHLRGDCEDAAGHDLAVGHAHPGEGTVLVVDDLGDRGVDDADAAGGEAGAAVVVQVRSRRGG